MAEEIRIDLKSSADTAGIDKMGAAVGGIAGTSKQAAAGLDATSKASKATAAELGRGVEIGNAAVNAFQNIAASGQGGAAGLLAITRAGFGAGVMFKGLLASMGPFGIAAAAIGIALGLISTALRKGETAAAEAKKKIDELNKAKLDEAVKQQEALKRAAEDTLRTLQAEAAAREQIGEAELGKRKAETIAAGKAAGEDPILTQQKLTAIDRQWEDEKRANALKLAKDEAKAKEDAQQKLEASAKTAADELAAAEARVAEVAAAEKAKQAAKDALDAETFKNVGKPAGAAKAIDPMVAEAYGAASARAAEAAKAAVSDTDVKIADLKKQLDDKIRDAKTAADSAAQARADAKLLEDTQKVIAPKIDATRKAEDAAKRDKTPAEEAAQKKAQEAEDARIRLTAPSVWNNKIATGGVDDATAAAVRRNFPDYKFVDRPTSATPAAPLTPTGPVADLAAQTAAEAAARAAAAKPSGGTIQRGGDTFKAGAGGLEKQTKELNETMQQAGEKAGEKVDLQPAVDGAKAVQEGQESLRTALSDATTAQADAMQAARDALNVAADTLANHGSAINAIKSEISSLRAQMRAARVK